MLGPHRHAGRLKRFGGLVALSILLTGCAGYNAKVAGTVDAVRTGSVDTALADLEKNNSDKDKDLLYHLEKGELLRMKGDYPASIANWSEADARVRAWEEEVKTDPSKVIGDIGSFVLNDTTRRYDGRDYEKVLLGVRLALDHVALGNWDAARVEIKKMHEREAVIAEFRSKELEDAKKNADEKGVSISSPKEISGYPVETLNAPEVQALKNAYESAVANYLAGFVYEALDEPSLAAAGYRKAIEMRGGSPLLEEALKNLDNNKRRPLAEGVDTLFIIETGNAPAIESRMLPIPLPIPSKNGLRVVMTPISWPVVVSKSDTLPPPDNIVVGGKPIGLTMVTSVDHMARRAISDEMPGIIARSAVRAIVKGATQAAIQNNAKGTGGAIAALLAGVAAVATEQADERTWRLLPNAFSIGRAILPFGTHRLTVNSPAGPVARDIRLSGKYAVVTVRSSGTTTYLSQTPFDPLLEPPKLAATQAAETAGKATTPKPATVKADASTTGNRKTPPPAKEKK